MAEDTLGSDLTLRADIGDGLLAPADMFFGYVPATVESPGNKNFRADGYNVTSMVGRTINTVKQSQQIDGVGAAENRSYLIGVDAGYSGQWIFSSGGLTCWVLSKSASGDNLNIGRYVSGAYVDVPTSWNLGTGMMTVSKGLTLSGGGSIAGITSLQVTTAASTTSSYIDSAAGQYAFARWRSGTSSRWDIGKDNGAESGSNAGSDLIYRRCSDSGAVLATAFKITRSTGDIGVGGLVAPLTDNSYSLGTGSLRFSVVYAATGAINTSDARVKQQIGPPDDAILDAWGGVEWVKYRFITAVAAKGDEARWHFGLVAQHVRDAIDARLGAGEAVRLGLVCHDVWEAHPADYAPEMQMVTRQEPRLTIVQDGDGNDIEVEVMVDVEVEEPTGVMTEVTPAIEAGDRWGLRYDECFALEAAWQRRQMARLSAQIALLTA